jgi:hypothetical protein
VESEAIRAFCTKGVVAGMNKPIFLS